MYVQVSRYKHYTRVRIVKKLSIAGKQVTKLVEHVGSARNETELSILRITAQKRLAELTPQRSLLDALDGIDHDSSRITFRDYYAYGLWNIIGGLYDSLGLPDNLLKYLVLARIAQPKSKLTTARYLGDHLNRTIDVNSIYEYMDTLDKDTLMPLLLAYAQKRAKDITGIAIAVVFYDVTTLYFETDEEDEETTNLKTGEILTGLRKKGYSKDHRFDLPQVVVGLTVDGSGFPLDFQVYEGNTYEGHTLMDGVRSVQSKLSLKPSDLTVVADAGMLSQKNTDALENSGYSYIVGARIKSLNKTRTDEMLAWDYTKHKTFNTLMDKAARRRLIVTYSEQRAKRSQQNRNRLLKKLQAKLDHGMVVKKSPIFDN